MSESVSRKHPEGLFLLFASEMWERFSYYGMRAVLTLYLTKALLYDKATASNLYGGYVGLIYMTPLIGGFIADRYWGNRRSIISGGILMSVGQFILFASAIIGGTGLGTFLLFLGLGLMIVGNGFFKPNISSMVGSLYPPNDSRRDSAYTIFYMGINTGAFLGNFIASVFGDTGNPDDFKWAFLACGIAMALGSFVFWWGQGKYLFTWDGNPVGTTPVNSPGIRQVYFWIPALLVAALGILYIDAFVTNIIFPFLILSALVIVYIVFADKTLTRIEREKVAVIFIVSFFVIFFWATFEQAPASLTFFADEQTDRFIGINTSRWIVLAVMGLLSYGLYKLLAGLLTIPKAFNNFFFYPLGAIIVATIAYSIVRPSNYVMELVPPSMYQNLNSFYVVTCAPLMALLWGFLGKRNAEPSSLKKMAIGLLLVTLGFVVIEFAVKDLFPNAKVSMMYLIGMYFLHSIGELCLSPIGLSLVNKLSPPKFVSLMMAVWFLAPAIANKAAGMISALYPEAGKTTNFLGIDIHNLYEFFLINVGISGIASLILFLLAGRLSKMMHGVK
jgi:proton-dependent oligopeptide transporter, POT family